MIRKDMEPPEAEPKIEIMTRDPQEDDPKLGPIIRQAGNQALVNLGGVYQGMGFCYQIWDEQKRILKEDHGIDWESPAEVNPGMLYD